ncbi:MAG: imidazolonepropionase [Deltaproteobacteria bacterium]|uniref:imidazolonepropionase n=1 Tax=Desulfobacula sp. TaxID=2593537 RepID=UPI00199917A1|nr:imidazolonepropionase [Candidatus Desulfobacula maris]MBL6994922.1 imidazolonepropionase [Desulfobacula sp.]
MTPLEPDKIDTLFINCHLATMTGNALSIIEKAALAVTGKTISWIGRQKDLPDHLRTSCQKLIDCRNGWILPGFVDCHTHLVWGGSRSNEFEMRLSGATYEEISKKGGGIFSTVQSTRNASKDELFTLASKRVAALLSQGITTLEIKSGYGLKLETELKMLKVIGQLDKTFPLHIEATFLGAHALPQEFADDSDGYIDLVTKTMLPAVKDQAIATAVDVFCERIAFNLSQTRKVLQTATDLGLKVKLHAEQLSDSNGAAMAAQFSALSCDHLEYLSLSGAKKMAEHNVTAVLLPGAFYFLKETKKPPVQILKDLKIPIAVSTDLNPGSSPVHSMTLILNMACMLFDLTCEQALLGATINGAKALGLELSKGSIEKGKDADLVVWDIDTPADLCYLAGLTPIEMIMIGGKIQHNTLHK